LLYFEILNSFKNVTEKLLLSCCFVYAKVLSKQCEYLPAYVQNKQLYECKLQWLLCDFDILQIFILSI